VSTRRDQLPGGPSGLARTVAQLQREVRERAAQLLPFLRRADSTVAASLGTSWSWYDQHGETVVAEDAVAGGGLALPYLPIMFAPARFGDWQTCTSGTFEDIHRATIKRLQAYAYLSIGHTSDVSGTTGEIQVTVNGVAVGSPTAVSFAVSAVTVGPFLLPGAYRSQVEIRVQARRTGGAGNIRCSVLAASGIQA
jgi:hypothetical protein